VAWTTSALLGQHPMPAKEAEAAASILHLGDVVAQAFQQQPTRGALETAVPADPTMDRFYERCSRSRARRSRSLSTTSSAMAS
jgi:cyanate lyase